MKNFFKKYRVLTHDGKFHADDVFAVAALNILYNGKVKVIRSRKPEVIKDFLDHKDIIVDNGRDYNPEKNIFDHHQEGGAGAREDGVPYAGFGLIWKHFGLEICLKKTGDIEAAEYVWKQLDDGLVSNIDATDTGYTDYYSEKTNDSAYVPDKIIGSFVPNWREDYNQADSIFKKLSRLAQIFIEREIKNAHDRYLVKNDVEEIYEQSANKKIIIFKKGYPWKEILIEKPEPLFVIFPTVNNDGWMIQAVPLRKDSQDIRKKFPESWRGKADQELEKVTGVIGARFCHNAGFLAVASDIDGALSLAQKATE